MAEASLNAGVAKKMNHVMTAVKKAAAGRGPKPKVELRVVSDLKAEVIVEYQRYMDPSVISQASEDIHDAIVKADEYGHIAKIEETGNGPNFADAVLVGLRPGMPVKAEAFFTTLMFQVTWRQVITHKGR
jgi:hypothetical protein